MSHAHSASLLLRFPTVRPIYIPRHSLLAPARWATHPCISLLAPAVPLLPLVRAPDRYLSFFVSLPCVRHGCLGEQSSELSCHYAPCVSLHPLATVGVWRLAVLPLTGWANTAAVVEAPASACGQAARGGGFRWPDPGQAQAQLATARPRHHPRPLVGRAEIRCSPDFLYVIQKKGEKHMLQVYILSVSVVSEVCASVSYGCCKSRSGCCKSRSLRCNGYTCMLQASVLNVSSVFSDVCCKCVYVTPLVLRAA
jgi:hypothetical protein